jgi:hypothetical protein
MNSPLEVAYTDCFEGGKSTNADRVLMSELIAGDVVLTLKEGRLAADRVVLLLPTTAHYCPLLLTTAHYCPLLPTTAHYYPLLPTTTHYYPLLPTTTH